jgi:hypothetical protein
MLTWARLGRMTDAECRANFVFDKGLLRELYDQLFFAFDLLVSNPPDRVNIYI